MDKEQDENILGQVYSYRILIEKHLQHQKELFQNFIDFRKAFDRLWHVFMSFKNED